MIGWMYLDVPPLERAAWLEANRIQDIESEADTNRSRMVCLIDEAHGPAAAAVIAEDEAKADQIKALAGVQSKRWFVVPDERLAAVCPAFAEYLKA